MLLKWQLKIWTLDLSPGCKLGVHVLLTSRSRYATCVWMLCLSSALTLGKVLSWGVASDRSVSMKGLIHRTQGATLSHVRPDTQTDGLASRLKAGEKTISPPATCTRSWKKNSITVECRWENQTHLRLYERRQTWRSGRRQPRREHCSCSPTSWRPSYTDPTAATHRSKVRIVTLKKVFSPHYKACCRCEGTCVIWMYVSWENCGTRKFSPSVWASTWAYSFSQEIGVSGHRFQSNACRTGTTYRSAQVLFHFSNSRYIWPISQ